MFTGIIEELGEVVALEAHGDSAVLRVRTTVVGEDIPIGASIAVNGVCLTVIDSVRRIAVVGTWTSTSWARRSSAVSLAD